MTWRVARSLEVLLAEVNAAAPGRDKASDGSIGDPNHSSRLSDHNPNAAGVVRARDIDHDPDNGCDAAALAEAIRELGKRNAHPALGPGAYVIWNSRIASDTDDGEPWNWEPYGGSNPHDKHVHVSVATAASGYDSTAPWGVMEESDDMAQHTDQLNRIEAAQKAVAADLDILKERAIEERKRDRASWRREAALAREVKRLGGDVDKVLAEVTDEP